MKRPIILLMGTMIFGILLSVLISVLFYGKNEVSNSIDAGTRQIIADGGFQTPKDIGDYLKDMFKDVIQEMLEKELALELGYEKVDSLNKHTENRRNGYRDISIWSFIC